MVKLKHSYTLYVIVFYILCSCSEKNDNSIKLEVVNKQMQYLKFEDNESNIKSISSRPANYKNLSSSLKSLNLINWKLKNNTDYDYFFIIDYENLVFSDGLNFPGKYIYFDIVDEENNGVGGRIGLPRSDSLIFEKDNLKTKINNINKEIEKIEGIEKVYTRNNYFVLEAGKELLFSSTIYLPIRTEPMLESDLGHNLINSKDKNYRFSISYHSNLKIYKDFLTEEDWQYLRENNIKPFVGKLESNKVSLLPR